MEKMLEQGIKKRQDLTKRDNVNQKPSRENLYKVEDKKEEDTSYYANQYWHKPDVLHESLDELLKNEGFDLWTAANKLVWCLTIIKECRKCTPYY